MSPFKKWICIFHANQIFCSILQRLYPDSYNLRNVGLLPIGPLYFFFIPLIWQATRFYVHIRSLLFFWCLLKRKMRRHRPLYHIFTELFLPNVFTCRWIQRILACLWFFACLAIIPSVDMYASLLGCKINV